jgi:hypothetical protein
VFVKATGHTPFRLRIVDSEKRRHVLFSVLFYLKAGLLA